ncbi:hypothetical protein GCK72_021425 [Caenorhabditis remanei]|uniref:F-box domain-containing protein n=1 Tax=Caenorhabditis remanei TaxID=31234 RepID=A0A6A5GI40_CAERE|nr:hypothetical protein GCK72_021425 [Caenorhabditis remanei]KAF1754860.1 hypothetical protein GCK72_021425 [Caenorhabditis remanei]
MSLFKFFSFCLPSRQSKRTLVLDLPTVAVSPPSPTIQDSFLLDMPDLVMREIVKNLDFLTIQQLRKTCYSLREFVANVKVDSRLKDFKIEMTGDTILGSATVHMKGDPSTKFIKSNYTDNEDNCEVKTRGRNIIINGNFADVFSEDFLIPMLKNQRSVLEKLQLGQCEFVFKQGQEVHEPGLFENVFDSLMKVLKSRDRQLQIEDLKVYVFGQDQLMQLLHYIDLKSLKRLEITRLVDTWKDLKNELMLDLSVLEIFENLKELRVNNFTISSPLRSIAHVPELHVHMHTICCDDVLKYHEDAFLLNMPDLVMREILKNLDFLSILRLRKTSYYLREFVDNVKVDSGLKNFKIEMTSDTMFGSATVLIQGYSSSKCIESNYIESEDGCEVKAGCCSIIINGNFVDVYSEDFLIPMLKNQKSVLEKLELGRRVIARNNDLSVEIAEKVFDCLMKVLKSRDRLLQVKDLRVYVFGQDQLMRLLHHIDLKSLKRLEVWQLMEIPTHPENNVKLMLDLNLLECAENLKKLSVCNFTISSPLRSIAHVPELRVHMHTIHCDEVLKFHETLRTTNFLRKSLIYHKHFPDKLRFINTLRPSRDVTLFYDAISQKIHLWHNAFALFYCYN